MNNQTIIVLDQPFINRGKLKDRKEIFNKYNFSVKKECLLLYKAIII